jgi:hypothetical protein
MSLEGSLLKKCNLVTEIREGKKSLTICDRIFPFCDGILHFLMEFKLKNFSITNSITNTYNIDFVRKNIPSQTISYKSYETLNFIKINFLLLMTKFVKINFPHKYSITKSITKYIIFILLA